MRLRQIEIFYHVYRSGSISGAARDLFVSQPSVSKVLRHLEDQIGFELFRREKGRLSPTDAAHELFVEVDRIYDQIRVLRKSASNIRNRRGGHLKLGVLPSLSLSVGPELIARLREQEPLLSFELTTLHSSEIARALFEKRADLCVGFEKFDDSRLGSTRVGDGGIVLVSGAPIEAGADGFDATILDGAEYIGMRESGPLGTLIASALTARSIEPDEIVTAHTYHVALSLARRRVAMALTDQFTAFSHLGTGLNRYQLDDLPRFKLYASMLSDHPEQDLLQQAMDTLRDILQGFAAQIPDLATPKV